MRKNILHSSLVLKLNGCWQNVGHMTVKETFNRLFSDANIKALDIVLTPDGRISHETMSYSGQEWSKLPVREHDIFLGLPHGRRMRVPLVVIAHKYMHLPEVRLQFNKRGLYTRDNAHCAYCGGYITYDEATNDHIIPVSRGGENNWINCVLSCGPCNTKKANKTPEEAGMPLLFRPFAPGKRPVRVFIADDAPAEHKAFRKAA